MSFCRVEQLCTNDKRKIRKKVAHYIRKWNRWLLENWNGRFYIEMRDISYVCYETRETNMYFEFNVIDKEANKVSPVYFTNFWSMENQIPVILNKAITKDLNIYNIYKEE